MVFKSPDPLYYMLQVVTVGWNICLIVYILFRYESCLFVCWSLTSLCHSNGHIETIPAREINPFTALTRIRSQLLRTQWSTSNHSEWTQLRVRPLSHWGWLRYESVPSLFKFGRARSDQCLYNQPFILGTGTWAGQGLLLCAVKTSHRVPTGNPEWNSLCFPRWKNI